MSRLLEEHLAAIARHLRGLAYLRFAILYGSATAGEHFRDLDIGLFVDRERVPSHRDLVLTIDLAADLERLVPYPVDVRVLIDFKKPLPAG